MLISSRFEMRETDLTLIGILDKSYDLYQFWKLYPDNQITVIVMLSMLLQCCIVSHANKTQLVVVVVVNHSGKPLVRLLWKCSRFCLTFLFILWCHACSFMSVLHSNPLLYWLSASYDIGVYLGWETLRNSNASFLHTCDRTAPFFGETWLFYSCKIFDTQTGLLCWVHSGWQSTHLQRIEYSGASTALSPSCFLRDSQTTLCKTTSFAYQTTAMFLFHIVSFLHSKQQ